MAVGVQLDFRGATLDQYDGALERMGLLRGGPSLPRELFHWVTKTDDGIRVIDVWETREAFEQFVEAKLRTVAPEVGLPFPPEMQFFDVHNYFAGGHWRG